MEDFEYINKELGTDYKSNDDIAWVDISCGMKLTEDFIEKFQDKICWLLISRYQKLSEEFIEKFKNNVNWSAISRNQILSEPFIKRFTNCIDWKCISKYQVLSETFIKDNKDKIDWHLISKYQKLSKNFIKNNKFKIILTNILQYQTFSNKFNKNELWQYQDTEFKKQSLIKLGLYKCYKDYFIAYKAIRPDRYSIYNFQYQYLPGETYESHCDCTSDDSSFGLNVGTYGFAKDYLSSIKGMIIKCKVNYEDIGRIVYDGDKVRCFKITVLE